MDAVRRARRSLLVFFAVLVPVTGIIEGMIIAHVHFVSRKLLVFLLMWTPALASFVARLALREGFSDLSFRLGGRRGLRALILAAAYPIVVAAISYGIAWKLDLATFVAPDEDYVLSWPLWVVPLTGSPAVRVSRMLLTHLTIGTLYGSVWAAGEEIGWRGYMLPRFIDAKIRFAGPLSGLIWAMWHWPLAYSFAGGPKLLDLLMFTLLLIPLGAAMARQRLESGSVLPAILLHATWNEGVLLVFGACSPDLSRWVGEGGILTTIVSFVVLVPFLRGRWPARRTPDAPAFAEVSALT